MPSDTKRANDGRNAANGREPLAIVGIGCRFPGGVADAESLWQLLAAGVDAIVDVPADRWDMRRFYHPDVEVPGKTYARQGGFLTQPLWDFDAGFFGMSPREAAQLDPQQRLLLEATWEAFEDAGAVLDNLRRRHVGVFVGAFGVDNLIDRMGALSRDLISPQTATSSTMVMLSNRLSHAFDFVGPSFTIDTACSSSLVATHLACQSLWSGESEIAVAAGVNAILAPENFIAMSKGGFLSHDCRCKAFDASADGFVRAEGVGVVVLKPLSAAVANGDRIYATILATGINQDGHTQGIALPNPVSQQALVRDVCAMAGIDARDISYVEAHGPGTQAGDPIEASSLGAVYGAGSGRTPDEPLWMGSIKTNVGHLEAGAGIAGLIKTALVLSHRAVPPNLHFHTPNPRIDFKALRLNVPTQMESLAATGDVYAAVNSFGYGGTNAHAVLSSVGQVGQAGRVGQVGDYTDSPRLVPLSARDETALAAFASSLADTLEREDLDEVTSNLCYRRTHHAVRAAVWARSGQDIQPVLRTLGDEASNTRVVRGRAPEKARKLLFVYTGMGAQYVGMGRELYRAFPVFRDTILKCDETFVPLSGWSFADFFAGRLNLGADGEAIVSARYAQNTNLAIQLALTELWRSLGVHPDAIVGHSAGEIGAACAAGALTIEEAVRLQFHRAESLELLAGTGSMLVAGLGAADANKWLNGRDDGLLVASINAPDSVTISGDTGALERLAAELAAAGVFQRSLRVNVAYHHTLNDAVEGDFRTRIGSVSHTAPQIPLFSTLLGHAINGVHHDVDYWWLSARRTARFEEAATAALEQGYDAMLEIGPHRVLGAAIVSCARAAGCQPFVSASMVRGEAEPDRIRQTLAELYANGVPIDWRAQYAPGRQVRLPNYPWQRTRLWSEAPALRAARVVDAHDPLLHRTAPEPTPAWTTDLAPAFFPYLKDHAVSGSVLFPGAGFIAMALAASRARERGNTLEGLRFERALVVGETTEVRTTLDEASGAVTIHARAAADQPWLRHARGRAADERPRRHEPVDVARTKSRCERAISRDQFYRDLTRRGLTYGPRFQAVDQIWAGRQEVIASLVLPSGVAADGPLHPVMLDSAFQALAAMAGPDAQHRGALVPVRVGEVRLHGAVGTRAWALGRVRDESANSFVGDVWICDEAGEVIVEVDGLRCERMPSRDAERPAHPAFVDEWEPAELPRLERTDARRYRLIAGEHDSFAAALEQEFRHHGHTCCRHNGAPHDGVIYVVSPQPREDGGLGAANELLRTMQTLARAGAPPRGVTVVTRGAFGDGDRAPDPEQAALWGLVRAVSVEHPELDLRLVDVETDPRVSMWTTREILGDAFDREVRLGRAGRLVNRLRPWTPPVHAPELVAVDEVAVMLRQERPGSLDALSWHEIERRAPGPGEVEIRSAAAAINFKDVLKVMNVLSPAYLEKTFFGDHLGMETAGTVVRVGEGVTGYEPGDEVVATASHIASYMTVRTEFMVPKPRAVEITEGPILLNYITAYYGLKEVGRLERGERVLIHLASGGVGQAAIVVARLIGAEIIATAGSEEKRAQLRAQGIEHVFDSRSPEFADRILALTGGRGVDVVLNALAGELLRRSWDVLAPYGRFVEIGKRDIVDDTGLPMGRFDENRSFAAIDVDRMMSERPALFARLMWEVWRLLDEGHVPPLPVVLFRASEVAEAFRTMSRAKHFGKVVVDFRWQRVAATRRPGARFRADRSYLVTGAFGGFGLAVAEWLHAEGAWHLVLAGRRGAASDEARAGVERLASAGASVDVRAVDVADARAVAALLDDVRASGPPLAGVFHAAMVLDDGLIGHLDEARMATVMRPKALGAWHLHRLTERDPIEHFVLFSSVASVVGNIGQAGYCAANSFLDGLARQRRAAGQPALSVAWGAISDAGVVARTEGLLAHVEQAGLSGVTTSEALAALERFMDADLTEVVAADMDWARWAARSPAGTQPRFAGLVTSTAAGDAHTVFRRELTGLAADERIARVETILRGTLAKVMGLAPDRVPVDRSLDSLGVDSLMAVELAAGLETDMGVRLATTVLMQGPTVSTLAAHVLRDVMAVDSLDESSIAELSEEEADAVLGLLAASGDLDVEALQP